MSNIYIIIPIENNLSLFINNKMYLSNFFYNEKLNLIKFNLIKNNKFKNININETNIKNIFLYENLNIENFKKIYNYFFKKINNFLKKNNYPILIEGIPCFLNNKNINIFSLLNNFEIINLSNSNIIIELVLYYISINEFDYFKKKILNIFFIFNNINYFKKVFGLIIINFININNKEDKFDIYNKINNFILKFKIKIFEYIPIHFMYFKEKISNIIKYTNSISLKDYKKDFIIEEIIIFNENYKHFKKICLNCKKKYLIIILISKIYNNIFYFLKNIKKIQCFGILLINDLININYDVLIKNLINLLKLIKFKINIFITDKKISDIIYILQNMNISNNIYNNDNVILYNIMKNNLKLSWIYENKYKFKINKKYYASKLSPIMFKKHILDISKSSNKKRILFHEWNDVRILKSASFCQSEKIAECYILGDPDKIYKKVKDNFIKFNNKITIINPKDIENFYLDRLIFIRKNKNLTLHDAKLQILDKMVLSTLILENNFVDGIVAGSINTTSNTLRPVFQIIKTSKENTIVSSLFIILLNDKVILYGDCAININPNDIQLSEIVIQAYKFSKKIGILPKIAMLSYSTYNSSFGESVDKIISAKNIILKKYPNMIIDGPLQYDAASSYKISMLKSPDSILKGESNIFIFPNLDSGNITYKAVQKTNNINVIGPILQGLNKPVNDLSRGSSINDIIYTIAITVIQNNF